MFLNWAVEGSLYKKEDGKSTVLKSAYKRESVPYETEFDAFDFGGAEGN